MDKEFKGLSEDEVANARKSCGSNELEEVRKTPFISKLIKNLGDPIVRILIAAFFLTLILSGNDGSFTEAVGIAVSVIVSVLVSTLSEHGSEKAFRKMQAEATKVRCEVIRGGRVTEVYASELVVGDIVTVRAGDGIGADGELISGAVSVDMSVISGESAEVRVTPEGDKKSLYRGSTVTSGKGIMRVDAVGRNTFYGRIAGEVQTPSEESPLRDKLKKLAASLSKFGYFCAAAAAISYFVSAVILSGDAVTLKSAAAHLSAALTIALSVVVVAVPEGLPMMITVVLSSNMVRLAKQSVRVRRPVGIETAGNVEILFTDKTGTLTYGAPRVCRYVGADGTVSKRSLDMTQTERRMLGLCAVFAGESRIESDGSGKRRACAGESADRALLTEYLECGEYPTGADRVALLPFDSRNKLSAATLDLRSSRELSEVFGDKITAVKGAPEVLIKYCKDGYGRDGRHIRLDREGMLERLSSMSKKGIRVLAIAFTQADAEAVSRACSQTVNGERADIAGIMRGATFFCFVGIRDEVRRESRGVVRTLRNAGIQTVMITGDSLDTASAIAKECGIIDGGLYETVTDGQTLRERSDSEIEKILPSLRVVARALPEDKSRLVRIAGKSGRITAMTGDGINDAPALKLADVGFAMGNGAEVAKEAADIILTDSNISAIEKTVRYGRTVFRSIRKFIVFQLIMNLSAVGISVLGPLFGFENPVTVTQMLWVNMIMDTLAAIAFAGEAPLDRYMKSPPIPKNEPVLNGDMITRIFVMGVYTVTLCLYYLFSPQIASLFGGRESAEFLSGFFALFVFCGVFGAFTARSGRVNIISGLFANPVFVTVIAAVFCTQVGMIYLGGAALRCAPLSASQMCRVILIALTVIPAGMALELALKIRMPAVRRTEKSGGT